MHSPKGSTRDGAFYLRVTYRYDDSEDMEQFIRIMREEDLSVTVDYYDDHVDVTFLPGW